MHLYHYTAEIRGSKGHISTESKSFQTPQKRWEAILKIRKEGSSKYGRIFLTDGSVYQIISLPEPAKKPVKKSRAGSSHSKH